MTVDNIDNVPTNAGGLLFSRDIPSVVKDDGSFIRIDEEQVLLSILETNGFSHKDSFEIEVYLYEQDEAKLEKQLHFFKQNTQLKNGMLMDDEAAESADETIGANFVE